MDERVYDFGPPEGDPERAAWEQAHGTRPVLISVFSAAESIERDAVRFKLPREIPPWQR
jgi:hypothetical protein